MSQKTKKILSTFISLVLVFICITPYITLAGEGETGGGAVTGGAGTVEMKVKIENPFKKDTIQGLIETIVNDILIPIGAVVAVVMIMYAGFLFVTARGEPGQITKAKDALLWAVIGAAILLGAWVISEVIQKTISELKT